MSSEAVLSAFSIIKLVIAVYLFSQQLPRRNRFFIRVVMVLACVGGITLVGSFLGFSVFPPLTDDASFFRAILSFASVLALAVACHLFLFEASPYTALFCCSMAYALENLSSATDRVWATLISTSQGVSLGMDAYVHYWAIAFVVYLIAYLVLIRRIEKNGLLQIDDPIMLLIVTLAVMVNIVLDLVIKDLGVSDIPRRYIVALNIIYLGLCIYVMFSEFEILYVRRLQMDVAAIDRLRATEAKQYEMSRDNIEAINVKCHDIRHQIRHLRDGGEGVVDDMVLADIAREVDIYDSSVRSGNDALDTILTEKNLLCEQEHIILSCMADGSALSFMKPADLYSFFGNALDNAIEAVESLDDPDRRSISLVVRRQGDMALIHVENYYAGNVSFDVDGLPLTTKADKASHGFGTKSMRLIVESYDGAMRSNVQEDIFHLNALIPIVDE